LATAIVEKDSFSLEPNDDISHREAASREMRRLPDYSILRYPLLIMMKFVILILITFISLGQLTFTIYYIGVYTLFFFPVRIFKMIFKSR